MSRLIVLFAVGAFAAARPNIEYPAKGVCDLNFCKCANVLHPVWTSINCTVPKNTEMDVNSHDLPPTVTELNIEGGDSVTFGASAFNGITDMRRIRVSDSKNVVFRSLAAVELSILNLYLVIEKCDILRFEKKSFYNLQGPLSVNITDCEVVLVEGDTFSWLLNMEISNIRELTLGSGAFRLDPSAANVGNHGPGMSVVLRNTSILELPRSSFGSSAAKVQFDNVDIRAILTGAFSANTYNIITAVNCSIQLIEEEAFSEKSLINSLNLDGCKIQQLVTRAFRSAIADINIKHTRFDYVETGAINTTVASVKIMNSEFHKFMEKGFELSSWNNLQMENNSFDELPPNAIAAPAASIHKLVFESNEIETTHPKSLSFIGKAATKEMEYFNNYYGQTCNCNISRWLAEALDVEANETFEAHSYCTVNEVLARCFHVYDQNMLIKKFLKDVCTQSTSINCEQFKSKSDTEVEIKNPRFPHKYKHEQLSARNKKVICIVIISCFGCIAVAILFSLYKWWKRGTGGCANIKAVYMSFKTACASGCGRLCGCGSNVGIDNARSISQLSVNEYSERHRLNESRAQDILQESTFHDEVIVPTEEKFTQTLPEELSKELLDNLKEQLNSPENYVEAREMIEHLYELTKITEEAPQMHATISTPSNAQENIYELPYNNTTTAGPKKKQMVSIGTRAPSLDKLMPLSPYYRQTALSHEYFEPRDLAVHLYAEIANNVKEKKTVLGGVPDIVADQATPRGPYLRAVLSSNSSSTSSPSKPATKVVTPRSVSTIKSNSSNSSTNMMNRPLPKKPPGVRSRANSGEGTSLRLE